VGIGVGNGLASYFPIHISDFVSPFPLSSSPFTLQGVKTLDQFNFHHVLAETPGTALVIFIGPDCGACRRVKGLLSDMVAAGEPWSVFEVDAVRDGGLAREFEVFHLPSLFLFRDGHYHAPLHAEPLPERIRTAVAETLARPPQEAP
jgi:thioredoxin-like negative regulator of GroEL